MEIHEIVITYTDEMQGGANNYFVTSIIFKTKQDKIKWELSNKKKYEDYNLKYFVHII
tara:strand:- start:2517 stop:2690 length:174 start_codon:yes stop_codon:yes gene_type:complete